MFGTGLGLTRTGTRKGPPTPPLSPLVFLDTAWGVTPNVGNASAWSDQSGNGNNVSQATPANQPAILSSGWSDGSQCLQFASTNKYLDALTTLGNLAAFSAFAVFAPAATPLNPEYILSMNIGSYAALGIQNSGGIYPVVAMDDATGVISSPSVCTLSAPNAGYLIKSASAPVETIGLNRGSTATGTGALTTSKFRVGIRGDTAWPFTGKLRAVLIYSSALSGANLTSVLDFCKNNYGTP